MSTRDKKLLVYLGALIILAAAYIFVGRPYIDKIDRLSEEKMELDSTYHAKKQAYDNKDKYTSGIESAHDEINRIMEMFPEDNSDEKTIMFIHRAENEIPIWVSKIQFAEETKHFVNGEEVQSASDVEEAQLENNVADAEGETGDDAENTGEGEPQVQSTDKSMVSQLISRDTEVGIEFASKYDKFKDFLAYLRDYEDRMVIKEAEITFDSKSELIHAKMVISQYAILGDDRVLPEVVTGVEELGTDNVFVTQDKGKSIIDVLADTLSDLFNRIMGGLSDELAEELESDYFISVNAVTDNSDGITIGQTNDVKEKSFIRSNANTKEDVSFSVSGSGGTYSVSYSVGDEKYEDEVEKESGNTMVLRVVSTDRMSDSDDVAVSLHVTNDSDIPVVVGIEGDDKDKPRIDVVEKNGDVTVK